MKKRILGILTIGALAMGLGWTLAAQQAAAPADNRKWKDQAEYDIYDAASKTADAKARIAPLDKWTQAYPQSDYGTVREDMYLVAYRQIPDCRRAMDTANKIRAARPNDFQSIVAVLSCVRQIMPPTPQDLTNAEAVAQYTLDNQDKVFAASNGASVAPAEWAAMKPTVVGIAQQTLAWVPIQQKNDAKAEQALTKYLHFDGTQSTYSYYLSTAMLDQIKAKTEPADKAPIAMFHSARAATYDGPNAMPAASRKQILDFVTASYTKYHGSTEGLPDLLALAKTNVFPPAGFTIKDINVINQEKADAQAKADAAQPDITFWRDTIRGPLTSADGAMIFEQNFKDAKLPGGVNGVMSFKGKIVSMTPTEKPKQLVVSVFDPNAADATINMTEALPGTMPVGEVINFNGVAKSFTKDPFMITFEAEPADIVGWTGVNAKGTPAGKGAAKGPGKAPASKGKAK